MSNIVTDGGYCEQSLRIGHVLRLRASSPCKPPNIPLNLSHCAEDIGIDAFVVFTCFLLLSVLSVQSLAKFIAQSIYVCLTSSVQIRLGTDILIEYIWPR